MAYDLCFSPEFFYGEGEPYDALGDLDRPTSVWAAIEAIRLNKPKCWDQLAVDVFDTEGRFLTAETVMDKVQETNTCRDLSSPVRIYIDREGYWTLDVYD